MPVEKALSYDDEERVGFRRGGRGGGSRRGGGRRGGVAAEADVEVVEAVEELEEALDLLGVIELGQQEIKLKELVELQLERATKGRT